LVIIGLLRFFFIGIKSGNSFPTYCGDVTEESVLGVKTNALNQIKRQAFHTEKGKLALAAHIWPFSPKGL